MKKLLTLLTLLLLTACTAPEFRKQEAVFDTDINGTWVVKRAELGGKNLPMPPGFELTIEYNRYTAGVPSPNDRGKLLFFGDELAGEPRRLDVIGEDGPNKGKRYPAIYRLNGRELEICYDLSEQDRPRDFVSREGTKLFRVTYARK
jgi:uncharacterized protein (TIGR03067 family)